MIRTKLVYTMYKNGLYPRNIQVDLAADNLKQAIKLAEYYICGYSANYTLTAESIDEVDYLLLSARSGDYYITVVPAVIVLVEE